MNHEFSPNPDNPEKCIHCNLWPAEKHGPNAICDSCNNTGELNPFGLGKVMALLCRDCIEREKQTLLNQINSPEGRKEMAEFQSPENQAKRLDSYNKVVKPYEELISNARRIDESIHLSTDIFNAKTVAFIDIRDAVYANPEIPQDSKRFELARICKERIRHFQEVIFELDKKKIEAYSEQKSWHLALNDLANKLRVEEREQLKISDITYDVKLPKSVTPRKITTSPKKASKEELRQLASELGMPEFTIQLVMTSKNWTIEQVGNHLRKTIKEGQSESAPPIIENPKKDDDTGEAGNMVKV